MIDTSAPVFFVSPLNQRGAAKASLAAAMTPLSMGFVLPFLLFFLLPHCLALQLCTNSMAPVALKTPLPFCAYNGSSCCNSTDDAAIQKKFESMDISESACAAVMKSILCAKCDPYSASLFNTEPTLRTVPYLCNSTGLATSSVSKDSTQNFCSEVWMTCKDISMKKSPFAGLPVSSSKLTDIWQSETDFCKAFGGSSDDSTLCFNGNSVSFNKTVDSSTPKGVCLEKIANWSNYLNMVAHPDGSNRVFLANQAGKIWLATVPERGSGRTLEFDESNPFLDITDEVHFDTEFGVMGLAFHPNFTTNGRFFVSYNCDKVQSASCSGRCSCNSDVGCDPSKLGTDHGAQPCQFQTVVSEFTVNSSSTTPSTASTANPSEVRRIFTMGLPYTSHHGGQILFGPEDGYLYFMMGDGGNKGDPFNFAQNKKSLLGKIMRLDIDNIPSQTQISDLGLWGNYSIPKDNPYTVDSELQAEIWALGLRNPWRCSFDLERPSYFFCADVGQETYEEVDLIVKGGNYGWRVYEGPDIYHPPWAPGGNTSLGSINPIFPIMGYTHSDVNTNVGSASITGGYVYRSMTDPCLYGRYLYTDLYAVAMWAGTEIPENSGNYTATRMPMSCSKNSPIACDALPGNSLPSLGYIFSFGEDNEKDVFLLTSKGVYRVVAPSQCGYACPKENKTETGSPAAGSSSAGQIEKYLFGRLVMLFFAFLLCHIY
ncbi:HIPL1 protein-like [Canna indica]|uniref:HIPL1 protein-like n=1 Tax=Canna indica TaxID=4628 RepID=A0AAQ3QHX5_9LILI|nr:HIPL1 protein-like [Canna indica]